MEGHLLRPHKVHSSMYPSPHLRGEMVRDGNVEGPLPQGRIHGFTALVKERDVPSPAVISDSGT